MNQEKIETKWLTFELRPGKGKTCRYDVMTKGDVPYKIGEVKWYGPFRKYSFFPEPKTVYDYSCMQVISKLIFDLEAQRRIESQKIN